MKSSKQFKSGSQPAEHSWFRRGSLSIIPPADYWTHLKGKYSDSHIEEMQKLSNKERYNEFTPEILPSPEKDAAALLDQIAADGWLKKIERSICPNCKETLSDQEAAQAVCPHCNEEYSQHDNVFVRTVYTRHLEPVRDVDWVVAIHGMNTRGKWQEAFNWHFATTWGRSVPVAIYKYGIILFGVLLASRKRKLIRRFRGKLTTLKKKAEEHGYNGKPDVIAHSFGTWLLGHLLKEELKFQPQERLHFGRIILTGSILRPDFDWKSILNAGLVEEILNHFGTKDRIVPLAHFTITDSGPSGLRGFDGNLVINISSIGYGHKDFFSVNESDVEDRKLKPASAEEGDSSHLEYSYKQYWRPFLTLPVKELKELPDRVTPRTLWQPYIWPLRGTLFPFFIIPLIIALLFILITVLGFHLWDFLPNFFCIAVICATVIGFLAASISIAFLFRIFFKSKTGSENPGAASQH